MSDINDFGRTSLVRHTTGLKERLENCTMTEQQEKILAVLDMSEEEQKSWCWFNIENEQYYTSRKRDINLADLAFRLRDELVLNTPYSNRYAYNNAFEAVYEHAKKNGEEGTEKANWGLDWSRPIHWIIAALLAKESK